MSAPNASGNHEYACPTTKDAKKSIENRQSKIVNGLGLPHRFLVIARPEGRGNPAKPSRAQPRDLTGFSVPNGYPFDPDLHRSTRFAHGELSTVSPDFYRFHAIVVACTQARISYNAGELSRLLADGCGLHSGTDQLQYLRDFTARSTVVACTQARISYNTTDV